MLKPELCAPELRERLFGLHAARVSEDLLDLMRAYREARTARRVAEGDGRSTDAFVRAHFLAAVHVVEHLEYLEGLLRREG